MNWVDYIIISIIAVCVLYGAARGLIHGLFSMTGFVVSIIAAKKYYKLVAEFLIEYTGIENILMGLIQKNKITEAFAFTLPVDKGFNDLYQYITMVIINCIAFFAAFMAAKICILLLEILLREVFKLPVLNTINHSGGAVLGLVQSILILLFCYAMLVPLASLEKFAFIHQAIEASALSKYFYKYNFILGWVLDTAMNMLIK